MGCLFGYCGPQAPGLLARMARLLEHRCAEGREQATAVLADGTRVEIGHGRAPWGRSAQVAQSNHAALGYAGALFNPQQLHVATAPDTAASGTLLTGLATEPARLPELEGAFVLALGQDDSCYLLRDHTGVKVLYWTVHNGRLLFASEIKALFADATLPRRLRPAALPEYLTFSFVPGHRTMFEGIEELQPGSLLRFTRGHAKVHRHFRFEHQEGTVDVKAEQHVSALRTALEDSVRECIGCSRGVPGVFLSGGIDSSAVLAIAAQQLPAARIPTFSVHFGAEYANENPFIELMVQRYRTDHHSLEVRPKDFLAQLRRIVWCLDDPIGDPVTMPNYLLAQAATRVTNVVLNGEGGDPCLGGPKNVPMLLTRLYGPHPEELRAGWLERNYLRAFQRCYQDLGELLDPELLRAGGGEDALIAILEPFFQAPAPTDFVNKLMSMNIRLKGANLILVKVDKMSSANGLLALPPLFSRRIVEASMACPPGLKLEGAVEKSVLKKAVWDLVPRPIIERPKSGMMVPVRFWFRGELRRYGRRLLANKNLRRHGLFNPAYVKRLLAYDMSGVRGQRHGLKLWMLITFLLWYEQLVEAPSDQLQTAPETDSTGLLRGLRFGRF